MLKCPECGAEYDARSFERELVMKFPRHRLAREFLRPRPGKCRRCFTNHGAASKLRRAIAKTRRLKWMKARRAVRCRQLLRAVGFSRRR